MKEKLIIYFPKEQYSKENENILICNQRKLWYIFTLQHLDFVLYHLPYKIMASNKIDTYNLSKSVQSIIYGISDYRMCPSLELHFITSSSYVNNSV